MAVIAHWKPLGHNASVRTIRRVVKRGYARLRGWDARQLDQLKKPGRSLVAGTNPAMLGGRQNRWSRTSGPRWYASSARATTGWLPCATVDQGGSSCSTASPSTLRRSCGSSMALSSGSACSGRWSASCARHPSPHGCLKCPERWLSHVSRSSTTSASSRTREPAPSGGRAPRGHPPGRHPSHGRTVRAHRQPDLGADEALTPPHKRYRRQPRGRDAGMQAGHPRQASLARPGPRCDPAIR